MELSGTLSNPLLQVELAPPARISRSRAGDERVHSAAPRARPAHTVAARIVEVLQRAAGPMRIRDIHAACERELGRPIPSSTVKDSLSEHTNSPAPRFIRITHGFYGLAGTD